MKKSFIAIIALLCSLAAAARERVCFDNDWKFILGDSAQMASVQYDDAHWRRLNVPHDWAIEGDFYAGNPSGAGGGALPGGIGWYRKHFTVSSRRPMSSRPEWRDLSTLLEMTRTDFSYTTRCRRGGHRRRHRRGCRRRNRPRWPNRAEH